MQPKAGKSAHPMSAGEPVCRGGRPRPKFRYRLIRPPHVEAWGGDKHDIQLFERVHLRVHNMSAPATHWLIYLLAIGTCIVGVTSLLAQPRLAPTYKDLPYNAVHKSQVMDVYLAQVAEGDRLPAMIFFHGGGWRGGSKQGVPAWLIDGVAEKKWSVIAVEYRFSDVKPHPAQVNDCLRAVQFVRQHANEWHIDPERIGVTGGSAGGHLSLWVALHDDVAQPETGDPVQQQSSRVSCAVSFAGPTDWSLLSQIPHNHPAYRQLLGYEPKTPVEKMDAEQMRDVSPISFASADDPPIMQVHGDKDDIVPIDHAKNLNDRLQSLKVRSELVVIPGANHGVAGAMPSVSAQADRFVKEIFGLTPKP